MSRYLSDDVLASVQRLRPIADGLGITMGQLALAWVLREPNLASAIVGASRPEQLADECRRVRRRARPVDAHRDPGRAPPVKARLFTDGGARGNPGPAAYGFVLEAEDGTVLAAEGQAIGVATNNVAEYSGLVAGLKKAIELHVPEVEVVSDSELLVKQMRGEYRVKNEALRGLFLEATALARGLAGVEYRHVKRAHNELADRLVNEALDST